jgi:RNA polymerase sigma factor (sigma-70 family)
VNIQDEWKELVPRLEADLLARGHSAYERSFDDAAWSSAERLLRLYGRALRGTDSIVSFEDVDDIVQDVLLKLQSRQTMHRLRAAGSPAGYVAVMMRNAIIDFVRHRKREVPLAEPVEAETTKNAIEVSGQRDSQEMIRMKESLRLLRSEDRHLLRMRFWKNMSVEQISEALGISYSATAVRLFRIMKRLRDVIGA